MSNQRSKPHPHLSAAGVEKQKQRVERQAALLRRNLEKRKAQQRQRAAQDRGPTT